MELRSGGVYEAEEPLHLPLDPPPGDWRLTVLIDTSARVNGGRTMLFQPATVPLRSLEAPIPDQVVLHLPWTLTLMEYQGDQVSGERIWAQPGGEVGLWWLPGPSEPLTQDTAQMMVEATYPEDAAAEIEQIEPQERGEYTGFHFVERWREGPAEAVVLQGPDRWLYLVRVRGVNRIAIPPLLQDIQASFALEPAE